MRSLYVLMFPDPPRRIPAHRALSIAFRTVHLATFGALLGGHIFGADPARLRPFLVMTIGSGAALMAIELASTFEWFLTVKGMAVLLKLALLAMIPVFWNHRVSLLLITVVVASISSHMPSRFRHYRPGRGGSIYASPKFSVDALPQGGRARRSDHSGG
jgi:hypothetical protein